MRRPADFQTSLYGMYAAMMMASIQISMQGVYDVVNLVDWWPFGGVVNAILNVVNDLLQWVIDVMFPGAPGSLDYLTSAPEALVFMSGDIFDTLNFFLAQRRYVQYQLIPQVSAQDQQLSWNLYYDVRNTAYSLYNQAISALYGSINSVYGYINTVVGWLNNLISVDVNMVLFYAKSLYDSAIQQLTSVMVQLENRMDAEYHAAITFATQVRDDLTTALNVAKLELAAAIAALGVWLTTTYIPGAFVAYTELTVAQIAAGMDILWPLAAKSITATAEKLALSLPLVAVRALDVPPEPVPGVGGMAEALASSVGFLAAVADSATAPMHVNLHKFGEDTHELSGIVGTLLLGGLAVAAITAPEETAIVVADALANPLNDVLTGAMSLLGLGG